jgi:hypothetical protein
MIAVIAAVATACDPNWRSMEQKLSKCMIDALRAYCYLSPFFIALSYLIH